MNFRSNVPPILSGLVLSLLLFFLAYHFLGLAWKFPDPTAQAVLAAISALVLFSFFTKLSPQKRMAWLGNKLVSSFVSAFLAAFVFGIVFFPLWILKDSMRISELLLIALIPTTVIFHLSELMINPTLDTRAARWRGVFVVAALTFEILLLSSHLMSSENARASGMSQRLSFAMPLGVMALILLLPGTWVFSMPSSFVSLIPLILHVALLILLLISAPFAITGLVFFMFAGWYFPKHRRMSELWRPARLPKIRLAER